MSAARRPGLYDPAYEHDACGVAFVARLDGTPASVDETTAVLETRVHYTTHAGTGVTVPCVTVCERNARLSSPLCGCTSTPRPFRAHRRRGDRHRAGGPVSERLAGRVARRDRGAAGDRTRIRGQAGARRRRRRRGGPGSARRREGKPLSITVDSAPRTTRWHVDDAPSSTHPASTIPPKSTSDWAYSRFTRSTPATQPVPRPAGSPPRRDVRVTLWP